MLSWRTLRNAIGSMLGGSEESEAYVGPEQSITVPPVWYAVNKIAGHIGQMPLSVYRRMRDGGIEKAVEHQAYRLVRTRPNEFQSAFDFRELVMVHALLWGNGRAWIVREGSRPVELLPLMPENTVTVVFKGKKYHVTKPESDSRVNLLRSMAESIDEMLVIEDMDCLHIKGISFDGIDGKGLIPTHKRTVRIAIESEKSLDNQLTKGFSGSIMLEAPAGAFADEQDAKRFIDAFKQHHSGTSKAGQVGLLREGIKANLIRMSNVDLQMIDQRRFSRQDIGLLFGLTMPGDGESVSYNSLEQKTIAYLTDTLGRWVSKWEEECDHKLLTEREKLRDTHYFAFDEKQLLRMDSQTQASVFSTYIASRVMNPNEVRAELDRNPYDGGDEYVNPAIDTRNQGDPEEPDEDEEVEQQTRATARKAVVSRIRQLLEIEAKRAVAGCSQKNFADWVDGFYAKWEGKLAEVIAELGGDPNLATVHCEKSKNELIEASGRATIETLSSEVSQTVASWAAVRAEELATDILGE